MPPTNELHVDSILTSLSIKYSHEMFIADEVLPMVNVTKRSDKYFVYKKSSFDLVATAVGPKAQPNEVDWDVGTDNYSVSDYALADYLPLEDISNADVPLNPRADTNEFLNEMLSLDREKRVADLVFAEGKYDASNKLQLAGGNQWGGGDDDPIANVQTAVEGCFMRANTLVFGWQAWLAFRQLPEVLDAVKSSSRMQDTPGGLAMREEIAKLFEVDNVLVGRARINTAKKGQAKVYGRVWGNKMAALHVRKGAGVKTITFGKSFTQMPRRTQTMMDVKRGSAGAEYIKVGYNCDEKIVAKDLGYLIYDAAV